MGTNTGYIDNKRSLLLHFIFATYSYLVKKKFYFAKKRMLKMDETYISLREVKKGKKMFFYLGGVTTATASRKTVFKTRLL